MKLKTRNIVKCSAAAVIILSIVFISVLVSRTTIDASASASKYYLNGKVNYSLILTNKESENGVNDYLDTKTNYPDLFTVKMYGSSYTKFETVVPEKIFNFSDMNFEIELLKNEMPQNSSVVFEMYSARLTDYDNPQKAYFYDQVFFLGPQIFTASLADGHYNFSLFAYGYPNRNIGNGMATMNFTFSFYVDSTPPDYSLKSGNTIISDGEYINGPLTYSAEDLNYGKIFYKSPASSTYFSTTSSSYDVAATAANNGWWSFYAEDDLNNSSTTISAYVDTIQPLGRFTSESGGTVTNGGYTNYQVKYAATDAGGVAYMQYKTPGSNTWKSYTANTLVGSSPGWYYFRAMDNANNVSEESSFYYDSKSPDGNVYNGNEAVSNGAKISAAFIKYVASDEHSGLQNCYVKEPGHTAFRPYVSGTPCTAEGTYEFYSVDRSDNQSAILKITLDVSKAKGKLFAGIITVQSGSFVNADYVAFEAADEFTAIKNYYVKKPDTNEFVIYSENQHLTAEGKYVFRAEDEALNMSDDYEIVLDRGLPTGTLFAGTRIVPSGTVTNAETISFDAEDSLSGIAASYVRLPYSTVFIEYTSSTVLNDDGEYLFYTVDRALNRSETVSLIRDRAAPQGIVYAGSNTVENGRTVNASYVRFIATDETSGIAEVYVKMPGDSDYIHYVSGAQLTAEGKYCFYAVDYGNNRTSEYTVILDRTPPLGSIYADSDKIADGTFINAEQVAYYATDNMGGLAVYVKVPGAKDFTIFAQGTEFTAEGTYAFYSEDLATNRSETLTVLLDRTPGCITLFAETNAVMNGAKTNARYIKAAATDALSGVDRCYVNVPGTIGFVEYVQGTQLTIEGEYLFYVTDKSLNRSATVTIILDRTAAKGQLFAGTTKLESGSYTFSSYVTFSAVDELSGIESVFVKMPGESSFISYDGAILTAEGRYVFYCIDGSNNKSADYIVTIDRTRPQGTLYAGRQTVKSGASTNAEYVTFAAIDNFGIYGLFVKRPGSNNFEKFTAGTHFENEGLYEFYAEDFCSARTDTLTIILDTSAAVGQIYAGSTKVTSGAVVASDYVSFIASDNMSGVKRLLVRSPNQMDFTEYESGRKLVEQGTYLFKTEDFAGNISDTYSVVLDRTPATITAYSHNKVVAFGTAINTEYIILTAEDEVSGVEGIYVKLPKAKDFTLHIDGTRITTEGTTICYALDLAGNKSDEWEITIDRGCPMGIIIVNGQTIPIGGYTNNDFSFTAQDSITNITRAEIQIGDGNWENYILDTTIPRISENTTYSFRAYDAANNVSNIVTVTLDTRSPTGQLFADGNVIAANGYTNADRIYFEAYDVNLADCFVLLPGAKTFVGYTSGALYSASGKYEFYCQDKSDNRSATYRVVIDRTPKAITLNGVSDGICNADVIISWANIAAESTAPVITVTVNGQNVANGETIRTVNNGKYRVESTDAAGNLWATEFVSESKDILTVTVNNEWWEAADSNGKYYAYETRKNALDAATNRERLSIRIGEWLSEEWDQGIMMDAADSVNAARGRYFIYKKSGDASVEVAYFTEERLNAVIREYAEVGIKHFFYFEGKPSPSAPENDIYSLNTQGVYIADKIELREGLRITINGEHFEYTFFTSAGTHVAVIEDGWGNRNEYTFIVVRELPQIKLSVGGGDYASIDKDVYYLKNSVRVTITDSNDEYAMFCVLNENAETIAMLCAGEETELTQSGKYIVRAVNHLGQTEELIIYISLEAPVIEFAEQATDKQLHVVIVASTDNFAELQSIAIYKSTDSVTWAQLTEDDYGTGIGVSNLIYKFRTSGMYRVVIEDIFRTGFEAVENTCAYVQPAPEGALNGVENGGCTNGSVSFVWIDEAIVTLIKNGETVSYASGTMLTEDGIYKLILENYDGYEEVFNFVIDTVPPEIVINGYKNGGTVSGDVSVTWNEKGLFTELYCGDKFVGEYENGVLITEGGNYRIVITDNAGNISEAVFVIDKSISYFAEVYDNGAFNEVTFSADEELTIQVTKDGEDVVYIFGETIKTPGVYTAILTDAFGNTLAMNFTVVHSLSQRFFHDFSGVAGLERIEVNGELQELTNRKLTITASGIHTIAVIVDSKAYTFITEVDGDAPTAKLNGVGHNSSTKTEVSLTDLSENAEVSVFINNEKIDYRIGGILSELGHYRIILTDPCGNETVYEFDIIFALNTSAIVLIVLAIVVLTGLVFLIIFIRRKGKFRKNKSPKKTD